MNSLKFDIAIIGAGSAGMRAYREASKLTDRIALIEGDQYGTTCARVGCMPSKLLISPAEAVHRLKAFETFGLKVGQPQIDGKAVMKRVRAERDRFVGFVKESIEGFDRAQHFQAYARFLDDHTLDLSNGQKLVADRIVIATGSRPIVPESFKAAGSRLLTSDDVFYWEDLPLSVAVFGAGVIGLELGQSLHRLGVKTALFSRNESIGPLSDPEVREYARKTFTSEYPFYSQASLVSLTPLEDKVKVTFVLGKDPTPKEEVFEYILLTTGRQPNTDNLGLENTSLQLDRRGVPLYNPASMQCGDSHVFIAGDALGDLPLLHEASDEGQIAGINAANYPRVSTLPRRASLGIVFSDPQIALVGKSFQQLKNEGISFKSGSIDFEDQGRARVMLKNKGLLHIYAAEGSGQLLGAEMIAPDAEHLAHLLAWSIDAQETVADLLRKPFYHPTLEEGLRTALRSLSRNLGQGEDPPPRCLDCGPGC